MAACTQCSQPLESGAVFCVNCGSRVGPAQPNAPGRIGPAPHAATPGAAFNAQAAAHSAAVGGAARGFVPSDTGLSVCTGCGLIAPRERSFCAVCDTRFAPARAFVPPAHDGGFWVAMEVRFDCRSCGQSAPLNHLDVDGKVECMHCGVEQRFDAERWTPLINQAHSIGDLRGPHPEGRHPTPGISIARANNYASIGRSDTLVSQDLPPLKVRMAPGHPLCSRCSSPLIVSERNGERIRTTCPGCADQRGYEMPPQARAKFQGLVGVLGAEHELGRHDVKTELDAGGAVVIRCPNCSAPLTPSSEHSVSNCQYCGVACRITPEAMWRAGIKSLRADWWWLLFLGPSEERQRLGAWQARQAHGAGVPLAINTSAVNQAAASVAHGLRVVFVWMGIVVALAIGGSLFALNQATSKGGSAGLGQVVNSLSQADWNGTGRAVLSDVNGDAVIDVVGRARQLQPKDVLFIAAFDGKDGHELWKSEELGPSSEVMTTPLALVGATVVIANDQAQLFAIRTKDGTTAWRGRLNEKVEQFCVGETDDQLVVMTKDNLLQRIALASGALSPLPTDPENKPNCQQAPTDEQRTAPPGTLVYEWSNDYSELLLRDRVTGISSDGALHIAAKNLSIALGHKNPGSRVPMLAAYRLEVQNDNMKSTPRERIRRAYGKRPNPKGEPRVLWQATVPGVDPLTVSEDDPETYEVHMNENTLVAAYELKKTHIFRLTAFDLETGTRLWDVELPDDSPMGGVLVTPTVALVSRWSGLFAFDIKTGKKAWEHQ